MTSQNNPAAEHQQISAERLAAERLAMAAQVPGSGGPTGAAGPEIRVGKRPAGIAGKDVEVFTMSLGSETIELLPLKTWAQLDLFKWRARGKLPGTPAGLEVAADHVKLLGQTVLPQDPESCAKLEALFAEWLAMERETLELARRKAQAKAASAATAATAAVAEDTTLRFQVEMDKESQVHVRCVKGKEVLATIGLNVPGFQSLVNQGWMRKPHSLKTGALHDWVELDGTLFSFEKGQDSSAELARVLNASYLPLTTLGKDKGVVVYANAASSTGFDIQFPAKVGGVIENRRRPLGEESLALLQDAEHCGLTQKGLVIKLSRPYFIFKQKTPDGGERSLEKRPENLVHVVDDDGSETLIDLSQPVSYLKLSAVELTAVFNHPSINPHAKLSPAERAPSGAPAATPLAAPASHDLHNVTAAAPAKAEPMAPPPSPSLPPAVHPERPAQPTASATAAVAAAPPKTPPVANVPPRPPGPPPNRWLKAILEQPSIRFDWFACLVYAKIANWYGNSSQGRLSDNECWFIQTGHAAGLAEPRFKGVFDTRNGSFGFLGHGVMLRFEETAAFVGRAGAELKGPDVHPRAVGIDADGTIVFIVADGFRSCFGVPSTAVDAQLTELRQDGCRLMGVTETLASPLPLEVVWTVPAQQTEGEPAALEHTRPG